MPHLGNMKVLRVFAKHEPYTTGHLGKVYEEMRVIGPPTIKVVEWRNEYYAIEGSHRLAAAFALGFTPNIEVQNQDYNDPVNEVFWEKIKETLPHYTWLI